MAHGRQVIALGGGGFSMEQSPLLDEYVLSAAGSPRPRICFLPTASGDNDNYIVRFYKRFTALACEPSHLELFKRTATDIEAFFGSQDIVYVGGGNAVNMMAVWKLHGVDAALRATSEKGIVLAGISAGSLCWFEAGVTDSFGEPLAPFAGLGLLAGSNCPHYDGEATRRPAYHRFIAEGMCGGIAADDGAALHFVDGSLQRVVSSRPKAKGYRVALNAGVVTETVVEAEYLGA